MSRRHTEAPHVLYALTFAVCRTAIASGWEWTASAFAFGTPALSLACLVQDYSAGMETLLRWGPESEVRRAWEGGRTRET